jgi:hypothetical protein
VCLQHQSGVHVDYFVMLGCQDGALVAGGERPTKYDKGRDAEEIWMVTGCGLTLVIRLWLCDDMNKGCEINIPAFLSSQLHAVIFAFKSLSFCIILNIHFSHEWKDPNRNLDSTQTCRLGHSRL